MPVRIPTTLPARSILERENIFVMGHERAEHQDIRPLRVAILNLMPTKVETETQLLRLLGNSALQVEITLLQTATYQPKILPPTICSTTTAPGSRCAKRNSMAWSSPARR